MDTLIKNFMSGQMSIVDFEKEFKVNSHLRGEINKLIPAEAVKKQYLLPRIRSTAQSKAGRLHAGCVLVIYSYSSTEIMLY